MAFVGNARRAAGVQLVRWENHPQLRMRRDPGTIASVMRSRTSAVCALFVQVGHDLRRGPASAGLFGTTREWPFAAIAHTARVRRAFKKVALKKQCLCSFLWRAGQKLNGVLTQRCESRRG